MTLRGSLLILIVCSGAFIHAHSGFRTLAWNETWGAYTVSVLEDFHIASQGNARLFVQLSDGREAAPESTRVDAVLQHKGNLLHRGEVPYLSESSVDGETSYAGYLLNVPLRQEGTYQLELTLSGPLGRVSRRYAVRTQRDAPGALEYLPSVLILATVLGGTALLFVPLKPLPGRRKEPRETLSNSPRD